jgi:hypothetical protein
MLNIRSRTNFYNAETHLAADEEAFLISRWYELGDQAAADRLYRSHRKLIAKIAREYHHGSYPGIPFDDLHQAAIEGFLRAIDRHKRPHYEPGHASGARLSTYAVGTRKNPGQVRKAIIKFADKGFKNGFTRMPKGELPGIASCDAPAYETEDGESVTFGDLLTDGASQLERGENWGRELPDDRLREIVKGRDDEGRSFEEIGASIGTSGEWARKLYYRAVALLTFPSVSHDRDLAAFLAEYDNYRRHGIGYLRRSRQSSHVPFDIQLKSSKTNWAFSGPRSEAAVGFGEWYSDPLGASVAVIATYLADNPRKMPGVRRDKGRIYTKEEIELKILNRPDLLRPLDETRQDSAFWYKLATKHAKQTGKGAKAGWTDTETGAPAVHEATGKSVSVAHIGVDSSRAVDCLEATIERTEAEIEAYWKEKGNKKAKFKGHHHLRDKGGAIGLASRTWDRGLVVFGDRGLPTWRRPKYAGLPFACANPIPHRGRRAAADSEEISAGQCVARDQHPGTVTINGIKYRYIRRAMMDALIDGGAVTWFADEQTIRLKKEWHKPKIRERHWRVFERPTRTRVILTKHRTKKVRPDEGFQERVRRSPGMSSGIRAPSSG